MNFYTWRILKFKNKINTLFKYIYQMCNTSLNYLKLNSYQIDEQLSNGTYISNKINDII